MNKAQILEAIVADIERRFNRMLRDTQVTRDAALEGYGRNTSRYDTMRIEGSWLADGLNKRSEDLQTELQLARELAKSGIAPSDNVQGGSLVYIRAKNGKQAQAYFLLPFAAGHEYRMGEETVCVTTPKSALGSALLGHKPGDTVTCNGREYDLERLF